MIKIMTDQLVPFSFPRGAAQIPAPKDWQPTPTPPLPTLAPYALEAEHSMLPLRPVSTTVLAFGPGRVFDSKSHPCHSSLIITISFSLTPLRLLARGKTVLIMSLSLV